MRRFVLVVLLIAALAIVLNQPATASIALSQELSFTLPILTGPIHDIDFYDIDGDHIPEVLAADSGHVVLYSISGDSVIFQTAFDTVMHSCRVLLDDIIGDGSVDIAVTAIQIHGYLTQYPQSDMILTVYNGATAYASSTVLVFDIGDFPTGYCNPPLPHGLMRTVDIDGDGDKEFVFSYPEYTLWEITMFTQTLFDGLTFVYHSFPDSAIEYQGYFIDIEPLALTLPSTTFLSRMLDFQYREYAWISGLPGYCYTLVSLGLWADSGLSAAIPSAHCPDWTPLGSYTTTDCGASSFAVGTIDDEGSDLGVVSFHRMYQFHYEPNWIPVDSMLRWLQMDRIISEDSTELVWTLKITDDPYSNDWINNLVFLPGYDSYFFGFYNGVFTQFDCKDGSINQATDDIPPGTLSWVEPYDDGQPLLIAINGAEVAFYRPDIVTGIFDSHEETILPESFVLGQPYPNPFNPTMSIPVTLNQPGHLTVEVYNPLGQKVAVLCDKPIPAGTQRLDWNAADFSSGVYMVRAVVGAHTETVKAVLLK